MEICNEICRGFHADSKGTDTVYINQKPIKGFWVTGAYIENENNYIVSHTWCRNHFEKKKYTIIPETLCRFTGYYDKCHSQIFENDIVDIPDFRCKVRLENGTWYAVPHEHHIMLQYMKHIEVLGNEVYF